MAELPQGWRHLTPEEIVKEKAKGNLRPLNTVVNDTTNEVADLEPESDVNLGFVGRALTSSALPIVAGRVLGASAGMLAGAGTPASIGLGIAGGVAGGAGAKAAQDWALNKIAENFPTSAIADFVRKSQADVVQHPYASIVSSLPASVLGGGGLLPKLPTSVGQAGKIAAIQGGVNLGTQEAGSLLTTGELKVPDFKELGLATVGGTLFSRPHAAIRGFERRVLEPVTSPRFLQEFAPPVAQPTAVDDLLKQADQIQAPVREPSQAEQFPSYFVGADVKELDKIGIPLTKQIARIKRAGVPINENDVLQLAQTPETDLPRVTSDLLLNKYMQLSGNKPGLFLPETDVIKSASQSAADITQAQKDARIKYLIDSPSERLELDKSRDARLVLSLRKEGYDVTPEALQILLKDVKDSPSKASAIHEVLNREQPTIPEKPETIQEQLRLFREDAKPAVLIQESAYSPEMLQPGETATKTLSGYVVHKNTISPDEILNAQSTGKLGQLLGYNVPKQGEIVVTQKSPTGVVVQDTVTTPENLPVVGGEGERIIQTPQQVIAQRLPAGTKLRSGQAVFTVESVDANGNVKFIGSRAGGIPATRLAELIKNKQVTIESYPESTEQRSMGMPLPVMQDVGNFFSRVFRPALSKRVEVKFGELGDHFKKSYQKMLVDARQMDYPMQDAKEKAMSALSGSQLRKTHDAIYDIQETGKSNTPLTPDEQAAIDQYFRIVKALGVERMKPNSPLVTDYDAQGNPVQRPFRMIENYAPQMISNRVWNIIRSGNAREREKIARDFIDFWKARHNISEETANKIWNDFTTTATGENAPNAEFRQLRFAEGVGVPRQHRENAWISLGRLITRQAKDLAFHRNIESDLPLAKALNIREDGRGNPIPESVQFGNRQIKLNELGADEDITAVMRDYVGAHLPSTQSFESWDRLAKSLLVQTPTQVWNFVQSGAQLGEVAKISEIPYVIKGLQSLFDDNLKLSAVKAGAVRPSRNINPTVASDANDYVNKVSDVIQKLTLTDVLEQKHRTFFYTIAEQIAKNRIRGGDMEFVKTWGPENPSSMSYDELARYMGSRLTQSMAGGYSAEELPNWVLRGSGSALRPLVSLSRWGIGRANRFVDNVVEPAKRGNIIPLLGSITGGLVSAEALNWLKDQLFEIKPKELTWEEWLKLDKKDTTYMLMSKASTAGYAGILSSLAFSAIKATHGEQVQEIGNPLIESAKDTLERLFQFTSAMQRGEADIGDLGTLMTTIAQDRVQILKYLNRESELGGKREERIAKRLGLTPKTSYYGGLPDPFSVKQRLAREDVEGLGRVYQNQISRGQRISFPQYEIPSLGAMQVGNRLGTPTGELITSANRNFERDAGVASRALLRR